MSYRCLYDSSCGRLLGGFLYSDLARSAPATAAGPLFDDLVRFSWGPLACRSLSKMVKVFYKSLGEDLVSIPVKCCQGLLHDLVQVLVGSSWRVLVKSSRARGVLTLDMIWYRSL